MSETFFDEDFVERIVVPTPPTLPEPEREDPEFGLRRDQKEACEREVGSYQMGTDFYYKHRSGQWVFTRGVRRFGEIFGAWEIVDDMCSFPRLRFRRGSTMQFVRITACKGNAVLEIYDDVADDSQVAVTWTQPYGKTLEEKPTAFRVYTESKLPDISITFCRHNGVLYAMEEH